MIQLLKEYANYYNIVLDMNKKDKEGDYSFLLAVEHNNKDILQLMITYVINNNSILNCNYRNEDGNYPLLIAVLKNNLEMVTLIYEHAINYEIQLEIREQDIINSIKKILSYTIKNVSDINIDIINIISNNCKIHN